jgi:hypothetical protein
MFLPPGRFLAISVLAFLALGVPAPAAPPPQKNPEPPQKNPQPPPKNLVHGEGCVQAGLEAHCLVLRDVKTGHLYDLMFKADRPPIGLGIEFTGVLHPGPTACMQGTAVDVATWAHKASVKCAPGQAGKHGRTAAH